MVEKESIRFESVAVPDKLIIACSLVANRLMEIEINGDPTVLKIGKDKQIQCSLEQSGGKHGYLSGIDVSVLDALHTLWEFGNEDHIISPGRIFRVMAHKTAYETPSDCCYDLISSSLDVIRKTKIRIISDDPTEPEWFEPLITLKKDMHQLGDSTQDSACIALLDEPVVLRYSRALRQISTVHADLLAVCKDNGKAVQNRPEFIEVRERMLRQFVMLSRMQKRPEAIKIDTILGCTRKSLSASKRAKRLDYLHTILQYWKKKGFIVSYCFHKRGYEYYAIQVNVSANEGKKPALRKNAPART